MTALKKFAEGKLETGPLKLYIGVHEDVVTIGRNADGDMQKLEVYYISDLPVDGCWSIRYGPVTIQVGRETEQAYKDREVDPSEIGYE